MPRAFMSWKNDSSFLAASSLKGREDSGGGRVGWGFRTEMCFLGAGSR